MLLTAAEQPSQPACTLGRVRPNCCKQAPVCANPPFDAAHPIILSLSLLHAIGMSCLQWLSCLSHFVVWRLLTAVRVPRQGPRQHTLCCGKCSHDAAHHQCDRQQNSGACSGGSCAGRHRCYRCVAQQGRPLRVWLPPATTCCLCCCTWQGLGSRNVRSLACWYLQQ